MNRINPNLNGKMIVRVVIEIQAIADPKLNSRNNFSLACSQCMGLHSKVGRSLQY